MTDSTGTEGSDGGEGVERDKKSSSTSTFENKATRDSEKLGEETKSDRTVDGKSGPSGKRNM